jgi:hypothetical protein
MSVSEDFIIEEEDLDEIEYLEILSLDEIIKENPSFIALSRDEIYHNLYELFKNKRKADDITQLFYDVINNNNEKLGKLKDYSHYVFKTDAEKQDYTDLDKEGDADYFNGLEKLNASRCTDAKNKYFFSLKYDDASKHMRFKPASQDASVLLEIPTGTKEYPLYYPVYPADDVNIPLLAAYYKIPTATINDYIYNKITAHLFNSKNVNYQASEHFTSINKLVSHTKPPIETVIQYLKDSFELDYNHLNNALKRFGYSLDFINVSDFDKLCTYMTSITTDKERVSVIRGSKIKKPDVLNKKMAFFDKLSSTMKLLKLSEKTVDMLTNLRAALDDQALNKVQEDFEIPSFNIYDIINEINTNNMTLEQVIDKIRNLKQRLNLEHGSKTIKGLLETQDLIEDILNEYENMKANFDYARQHTFDYDKDGKSFVVFYKELHEILEGANEDNYEGIPEILKNNAYEAFEDMDNVVTDVFGNIQGDEDTVGKAKKNDLEKYWLNLQFKDDIGFVEMLRILLPMIGKIEKIAALPIDYHLLCAELFKTHRGVSTKYNDLQKAFDEKGVVIGSNVIADIAKVSPYVSFYVDLNMGAEIKNIIVEVNKNYAKQLNDIFCLAIAWWSIDVQERILGNTLYIDDNALNPAYIDKWYAYGMPIQAKEKNGVLPYLAHIIIDMLKESNEYVLSENIQADALKVIETDFKDVITILRKTHEAFKEKKKVEQGVVAQRNMIENIRNKKFDKIATDFINALIYMPGVNYKKVHKFLLGCCLQKIDKDFKADNDLIAASRKDLLDIKKRFATRKETNKKRYVRYYPIAKKPELEEDDDISEIMYMKTDPYVYTIANNNQIIDKWLDTMYDKSPLLPNAIIDEVKNNPRKLNEHIDKHIKIMQTTARNRDNELSNLFLVGKMNYKLTMNLLLSISKLLNTTNDNDDNDDDNVKHLLKLSIDSIKNIIPMLNKLNRVYNEDVRQDIDKINAYVVSRAMCLPSNPELNINNYLVAMVQMPANFIENNTKRIYTEMVNILKFARFPTMAENIEFLNKKREENKQQKLSILNNKTVEENQLISNLKKAGIKHNLMQMELEEIQEERDVNDDIYQNDENADVSQGENDFKMHQEDYDDDESMDAEDMGFIYSR